MHEDNGANSLRNGLWSALRLHVPRLLTLMERDADSPFLGCFDRDFWHYKMRDFSSMILQQGLLVLDCLKNAELPGNILSGHPLTGQWVRSGLRFWAGRQRRGGGFDEYYPYENGFPPAAFSLYAVALLLRGLDEEPEPDVLRAVQACADWLLDHPETKALNQECAGLSGLALAGRLPGIRIDAGRLEQRLQRFFAAQSDEGWFPEYGGPDLGYLAVTIDCLWDYYEATDDDRALQAMRRAAGYMAWMLAPGGRVPVMANSRNTDYLAPYGLTRLAATDAVAAAVVRAMLLRVAEPDHYLHATDDRYASHYLFQSHFRCLPHLAAMTAPDVLPCEAGGEQFFVEAGQFVRHGQGRSLFFAGKKGGVTYVFGPEGLLDADYGWRAFLPGRKGRLAVTHWQSDAWEIGLLKEGGTTRILTAGPVTGRGYFVSSPLRHVALRVLSFCFGNRLIPLLKEKMIFRGGGTGLRLERELRMDGQGGAALEDALTGAGAETLAWRTAPQASLRHVASAARFCGEELLPEPRFESRLEPGSFLAWRGLKGFRH
ncbi:MAG: hypothetical protein V3573_09215 [Desulfovibrionaceae bacterium]